MAETQRRHHIMPPSAPIISRVSHMTLSRAAGLIAFLGLTFMYLPCVAGSDRSQHIADVGRYIVRWRGYVQPGKAGDVIEILAPLPHVPGRRAVLQRVYRYPETKWDTWLDSVCVWHAPDTGSEGEAGLMLTLSYGAGSSKKFVILANTRSGFREVFNGLSDRIGNARSLEMVDLNGDGETEIVFVPSYANFRGSDPGDTRAQVWKWEQPKERYVKVRESAYSERLNPLHAMNGVQSHKSTDSNTREPSYFDLNNEPSGSSQKQRGSSK